MLRKAISVIATLAFSLSHALADPPLSPGKPAGVHHAQIIDTNGTIAVGALVVIAVAGFALASHPYQLPGATAATSTQP